LCTEVRYEEGLRSLEWYYLEAIMNKLGISPIFVETIMCGARSVTFSVLFNGGRTKEFKPTRGVRQGDPIFPSLSLGSGRFVMSPEACYGCEYFRTNPSGELGSE
jgi:hypothetical protein